MLESSEREAACTVELSFWEVANAYNGRSQRIRAVPFDLQASRKLSRPCISPRKSAVASFPPRRHGCGWITGIHVSLCQQKSASLPFALWRARCWSDQELPLRTFASRRVVPALSRTGHPFAASGSEEPSQKIEFVFSASPETIRREPRESPPSPGR
jgi:hypothetical protein